MANRRRMDPRALGLSEDDLRELGFSVGRSRGPSRAPADVPAAPPPRRRTPDPALVGWLATVLALLAAAWSASPERGLPAPVPAAGPDTTFSSARALAQLVELAQRPHPTGSPEHERVRERIVARLTGLGLRPEVQTALAAVRDSASARAATVRNVVARIAGSASTGTVVLVAHYDGAPLSPAAADDAMGVAAVLETARALLAGPPPRNDVVLLLSDAGVLDGLGARAFAEQHPLGTDVAVAISADVMGGAGAALTFDAGPRGERPRAIAAAARGPATGSLPRALLGSESHPELAPFLEVGAQGIGLTTLGKRSLRHRPVDVAAGVEEAALQDLGDQLLAVARSAAAADLDVPPADRAPATVSISVPRLGVVRYTQSRSTLATAALCVAWLLLVALLLRGRGGSARGLAIGAGMGVMVVGGGAAIGRVLLDGAGAYHPELGMLDTAFYRDGPYLAALAALVLSCASTIHALAGRWIRAEELVTGALTLPLAATVWIAFVRPAASPAVQWALAGTCIATTLLVLLGERRARKAWARVLVVAMGVLVLLVLAPALQLVAAAWTLRRAADLGAAFGLAALLMLPVLEGLRSPRSWLTPAAGIAVASVLIGIALPAVRGAVAHPVPSALVYLADEPAPSRLPPGVPAAVAADQGGPRRMMGEWLIVPGSGERWGRSWVVEPARAALDPGVLLLPGAFEWVVAGGGPESLMSPPTARVVASRVEEMRRYVRLVIEPGLGGEMMGVHLIEGSGAELTAVGDVRWVPTPVPVRTLTHWGRPSAEALVVELAVAPERSQVELIVVEHHLRPREALIETVFERPDSLVPNAAAGSDRAIQRTRLRISLAEGDATDPE